MKGTSILKAWPQPEHSSQLLLRTRLGSTGGKAVGPPAGTAKR